MALNLKSDTAHALARELAQLTGDSMTQSVVTALREAIDRRSHRTQPRRELLGRIARHCAELPVLDERSADAILGYDDTGLPR